MSAAVPMTVIGGFLGTGKTTLLNRVLAGSHGVRYAVLVNDFGALDVDAALVTDHGGDTVSFANGCVCCTLGDGMLEAVDRLLGADAPPEQFLVEASGVSDPRAIAEQAVLHPRLARDLVVVLADAESVRERAADPRLADTVQRQLHAADLVVLNRCDRVGRPRRDAVMRWLEDSGFGPVACTSHARLPSGLLAAGRSLPEFEAGAPAGAAGRHAPADTFHSLVVPLPDPVDPDRLAAVLRELAPRVLRIKGFVRTRGAPDALHRVHLAGKSITVDPHAAGARQPEPGLVLIGLDPLPDAGHLARSIADRGRP